MLNLELSDPPKYVPDTSAVPEAYLSASFDTVDLSGHELVRDFFADYLRHFSHSGRDSLVLMPGELAARVFVALYRAIGERVTADCARFISWPAYSAWLRSEGWSAENRLLDGLWGTRFVFLWDVAFEKEMDNFGVAVRDCIATGRKLYIFTRDVDLLARLPEDIAAALDGKALPVTIKD